MKYLSNKLEFELCQEHLDLLTNAEWDWDNSEIGGIVMDSKRPYGTSDWRRVARDIADILGVDDFDWDDDDQCNEMLAWHYELPTAFQIIMSNKTFQLGNYERENIDSPWKLINE